jgi:hypothetical protein
MEKIVAKEIRTNKRKWKENKWAKWIVELDSTTKWVVQNIDEKMC